MNTTFRTMLCSALLASIISSAHPMEQKDGSPRFSEGSNQNPSFSKAVWGTGVTAILLAIASYTAYRIYKNKTANQTIEGKINTASNILTEISKDTLITDGTEAENDSNLALQATKRFTESQYFLILAQNYLVAHAAQLAAADRCITEARTSIKNALENKKATTQEKDRLNKLDDTCRQIKKHITAYTDLIDKKLTTLLGLDGYEVQLALYAQADVLNRDGWWKGANLVTYSLLTVIGMIIAISATAAITDSFDKSVRSRLQSSFGASSAQPYSYGATGSYTSARTSPSK